jgi:BTB/POZ domain
MRSERDRLKEHAGACLLRSVSIIDMSLENLSFLADVSFKTADGQCVKAHKAVIAKESPVFRDMFEELRNSHVSKIALEAVKVASSDATCILRTK